MNSFINAAMLLLSINQWQYSVVSTRPHVALDRSDEDLSFEEKLNVLHMLAGSKDEERDKICLATEEVDFSNLEEARLFYCQNNHAPEVEPDLTKLFPGVWQEQPSCLENDITENCTYNHKTGRGLAVLSFDDHYPQTHLVCAHYANWSRNFVSRKEKIGFHCRVTSSIISKESKRKDVKSLYQWQKKAKKQQALAQPKVSEIQCKKAFSFAYYCSPSLIILPTHRKRMVQVCGLDSYVENIRIPFVDIYNQNSQWRCHEYNLNDPDTLVQVSKDELQCVPNRKGEIRSSCKLPFIPVTVGHSMVRSGRCFFKRSANRLSGKNCVL